MTYSEISQLFQIDPSSKHGIISTDPAIKLRRRGSGGQIHVKIGDTEYNLRKIVWMLYNKCEIPAKKIVLPKNGCPTDYTESNLVLVPIGTKLTQIGVKSMKSWIESEIVKPKPNAKSKEPILLPSTFNYILRYLEPYTEIEYYRHGTTLVVHPTETNEFIKISRTVNSDEDVTESDRRYLLLNSRVAPDELIYKQFNTAKLKQISVRSEGLLETYL